MAFTQSSDKWGSCSSLVDLVVLNYHSWFPTTKVTSDGKQFFYHQAPVKLAPEKGGQSFSDWLRNRGQKVCTTCFKCCRSAIRISHLGMAAYVWPPPHSHRNPYALGAFPRSVQWRPPNRTNHCWLKVSTRGCRQFRDTVQCSQGTQGHRHKNGIWRADLLDQWPYLDEEEFRQMNAVLSCP